MREKKPTVSEISLPITVITLFVLFILHVAFLIWGLSTIPLAKMRFEGYVFFGSTLCMLGGAVYNCFMRMTINSEGISYKVSKKRQGAIRWEDAKTVAILRLTGGERLILISTLPPDEIFEVRNPLRNNLPISTMMKISYSKKRLECIQAYWPEKIEELRQYY